MNWDPLQKLIGFMNMKLVLKQINKIALDTITMSNIGQSPSLDRGEVATYPQRRYNATTHQRLNDVGGIIHCDIVHGTCTAIGGIKYVLVLIDKHLPKFMNMV